MMEPTPIASDLLALYLAGEADDAQGQEVEAWAAAEPEHLRELEGMRRMWEFSSETEPLPEVDVDVAWTKLRANITLAEGKGRVRSIGSVTWTRWVAAAAIIIGVVFAARWFFQPKAEHFASTTEVVETILADNSRSVLSPGSSLEVRMGRARKVRLSGEAYFEVVRDSARPFVVESGEVKVTVLGTSFEVSAFDSSEVVRVRVRSGRVRVEAYGDTVELMAGQHAHYHKKRHILERKAAPPAEVWGLRVLVFEGATLREVVDQLQRNYGVRIDLRNASIERCRLTAEFDDEPIGKILGVIADTFGLELERAGDGSYMLEGDGC